MLLVTETLALWPTRSFSTSKTRYFNGKDRRAIVKTIVNITKIMLYLPVLFTYSPIPLRPTNALHTVIAPKVKAYFIFIYPMRINCRATQILAIIVIYWLVALIT